MMNRHASKPDTSSETTPEETKEKGLGRNVIALGWVAFFGGLSQDMILPILPTFYYALTEGAAKAMIAELVPDARRGGTYGLYNAAIGVMALPASVIAGALWTRVGPAAPFVFGSALAAVAIIALHLVPQPK
jgi:MFS family permease